MSNRGLKSVIGRRRSVLRSSKFKGELIEEYYANEPDPARNAVVERKFLASPEGKERYAFTQALGYLKRDTPAPPTRLTFFERLKKFFRPPSVFATAGAAAVIVIIAGVYLSLPAGGTYVGPTLASSLINREQEPTGKSHDFFPSSEVRFVCCSHKNVTMASYRDQMETGTVRPRGR